MTTDIPEVLAYATHHDEPMLFPNRKEAAAYCEDGEEPVALICLSDYEALTVAYEEELFQVRQDRDTHFGELIRALEQVDAMKAECEKLRAAMIEAKGHIGHYLYGGSSYREPAVAAIELIDDALQEGKP